jgi:hypothetical protein
MDVFKRLERLVLVLAPHLPASFLLALMERCHIIELKTCAFDIRW